MGRKCSDADINNSRNELENEYQRFDNYINQIYLEEQPYYRAGMQMEEAKAESTYLNENIDAFINGTYKPLWKQNLYSNWFK